MFEFYVRKLASIFRLGKIDFYLLAKLTENYNPADIVSIIKEFQNNIVEEINEKKLKPENRPISTEDFIEVINRHKPSINPSLKEAYKVWNKQYGTLSID
ncbi:MAG: hypothetical protein QW102_00750 [Candidatus Nezhaarchaeales archaeon]